MLYFRNCNLSSPCWQISKSVLRERCQLSFFNTSRNYQLLDNSVQNCSSPRRLFSDSLPLTSADRYFPINRSHIYGNVIRKKRIPSSCRKYATQSLHQKCNYKNSERCYSSISYEGKDLILGIETSCDDTGAAVVDSSGNVLGESLVSQEKFHILFGGIHPTLSRRYHSQNVKAVVKDALKNAQVDIKDLSAIGVTVKPGLKANLTIGVDYAKKLAIENGKPFIPVHHMQAHALSARMHERVDFPFLNLLVSGGHGLVTVAKSLDEWILLGEAKDKAPGEAFDKVARRLKLRNLAEYRSTSGGQAIELVARRGNPKYFHICRVEQMPRDGHFYFSGLKGNALEMIVKLEEKQGVIGDKVIDRVEDFCASFQHSVVAHTLRTLQRIMTYSVPRHLEASSQPTLVISGGVACNGYLKACAQKLCDFMDYKLVVPPPLLCRDNGVMIAWNAMEKWVAKSGILYSKEDILAVEPEGKSPIGTNLVAQHAEDIKTAKRRCKWVNYDDVHMQNKVE